MIAIKIKSADSLHLASATSCRRWFIISAWTRNSKKHPQKLSIGADRLLNRRCDPPAATPWVWDSRRLEARRRQAGTEGGMVHHHARPWRCQRSRRGKVSRIPKGARPEGRYKLCKSLTMCESASCSCSVCLATRYTSSKVVMPRITLSIPSA